MVHSTRWALGRANQLIAFRYGRINAGAAGLMPTAPVFTPGATCPRTMRPRRRLRRWVRGAMRLVVVRFFCRCSCAPTPARREAAAHVMRCDVPQRPHQPAQVGRSELLRSQQQRRREQEETAVRQRRNPRHQQSPLRRMWQNRWGPMFAWKGWRASATYPPSSSGSP